MQSTLEQDDKQAGLNDLVAILDPDPSRVMLEPPDLHSDPVERAMALAAQLPPPDPAMRAAPPPLNDNVAPARQAKQRAFARGAARGLLAIAVGMAVTVGLLSYGEAARQMLAAWVPQLVAATPAPATKVVEQAVTPAETVVPPPAVTAPAPVPETPAAPAQVASIQAATPDLTPKLEEMAREIASLRETIEQLKSGQQQLSRDLAKEQEVRRKAANAALPSAPKPVTAAVRNPSPYPSQPAYAPPPPQRQVYVPRDQVYVEPPRVYTPAPPQVYVPPPYDVGAPRPPRPLP